jgi:hypothetical protein
MNGVIKRHMPRSLALSRGKRRPRVRLTEQFIECRAAFI